MGKSSKVVFVREGEHHAVFISKELSSNSIIKMHESLKNKNLMQSREDFILTGPNLYHINGCTAVLSSDPYSYLIRLEITSNEADKPVHLLDEVLRYSGLTRKTTEENIVQDRILNLSNRFYS